MKDKWGKDRFISERIRKRVTVLLAFFVVLSTSYAMIKPGETLNRGPAEGFVFFEGESTAEPELINAQELIDEEMAKESAVPVETEEPQPAEETPLETELPTETMPADDTTVYTTPEPTSTPAAIVEPVFTENPVIAAEETQDPEETVLPEASETPEPTADAVEEETPDPEETPEAEESEATIIYDDWMSVKTDDEKFGLQVKLQEDSLIPEDGKIELITLDEDYEDYSEYRDKAIEAVADEYDLDAEQLNVLDIFDLSFYDKEGTLVQPSNSSKVKVNFDQYTDEEKLHVVHFKGSTVKKEEQPLEEPVSIKKQSKKNNMSAEVQAKTINAETDNIEILEFESEEDGTVTFETESFSVYAVVEEGDTGDYARMNLHFMNGETNVATVIVKNSDTLDELGDIIYDPGAGTMHEGEIFKGWYAGKTVTDGEGNSYISFEYTIDDIDEAMDIDGVRLWASERIIEENEDVYLQAMIFKNYVVNYLDENEVGLGSTNVMLAANAASPNVEYTVQMAYEPKDDEHDFQGWYASEGETNIVSSNPVPTLDETGKNLYKNGTQLVIKGNITFSVNAPEGHWLVFDENGKGATYNAPQFVKSGDKPIEPNAQDMVRFGYTFGGWYTDAACTNGNEFDFNQPLTDKTTIYAKWTPARTANYTVIIWKQDVNGNGYDFEESINLTGNTGTNVNTVTSQGTGNNRYARVNGSNKQYQGFHLDSFDSPVVIVPEGTAVVNIYYNRNQHTFTFQDDVYTVSTGDNDNYPEKYGDVDGQKVRVYWNYGRFRTSNNWYGTVYTGTVYTRDLQTIHTVTKLYEQDISDIWSFTGTNGVTYPQSNPVTSWTPQNSSIYTARITRMEIMPDTDLTFLHTTSNNQTRYFHYYVEAKEGATNTRLFNGREYSLYTDLPNDFNIVYYNDDFWDLRGFTRQAITKSGNQVVNLSAGQTISWTTLNNSYGGTDDHLYFYYLRKAYPINFMDGVYVDGNNNPISTETARGQLGVQEDIPYESDISSYNKGGNDYFKPEYEGYAFEGWYLDDACTQPYTFTTMPEGGVTVYAKWRQIQYRVFLHPNADGDQSLDWGSASQAMNFRVSLDGTVSVPTGRRAEWEFVGWYTDPSLSARSHFNPDTKLNEDTVTTPYDKTVDMTDPTDKFGNGATYNSDITGWDDDNNPATPGKDRFWMTKKLDLYAKWRAKIVGAKGIGVQFEAGQGKITVDGTEYQIYSDGNLYLDQAQAPTLAASTPDDPTLWEFQYWVLQKWVSDNDHPDGGYYEDTTLHLNPGDSFEVLKDYARQVVSEYEDDGVTPKVATYTVQVRAQYKMKSEEGPPSHIYFYGNNHDKDGNLIEGVTIGEGGNEPKDETTYSSITINQAYDILSIESVIGTSTLYRGYKFLGWAKERTATTPWATLNEDGVTYTVIQHDNSTGTDLTLTQVTKIAADEKQPYEDLYAVWEIQKYKVTIKKTVVNGSESDLTTPFTINYDYDKDQLLGGSVYLKDSEEQIVTTEVPYETVVTVSELSYPTFETVYSAQITTNDQGETIDPTSAEISGDGYKVTGDITITVTNTKKSQNFSFTKTFEISQITGDSSSITDAEFVLTDITDDTKTYTAHPSAEGVVSFEGIPFGNYTLSETIAPTGYLTIEDHTVVVDENGVSIKLNGVDIGVDGVYTINDPIAETGTITIVKTNETGSKQLNGAVFEISTYDKNSQKYLNPITYTGIGNKEINELKLGTKYQLKEVQAPDGYIILGDLYYFQIKLNGIVEVTDKDGIVITDFSEMMISLDNGTITVKNHPGQALPMTGGSGTLPYTLSGFVLILFAVMYSFRMRRRERRNE